MKKNNSKKFWEILVPTKLNNGKRIPLKFHKEWDKKVRAITTGLTIMPPNKGEWVSTSGDIFKEKMVPVRIMATKDEMETIVNMTAKYYNQLAIMYYVVSNDVKIKYFQKYKCRIKTSDVYACPDVGVLINNDYVTCNLPAKKHCANRRLIKG